MWLEIAFLIISIVVSYALAPKPTIPKPPSLADFDVPTAEEGRAIPWVWGEGWIKGYNVHWYGDLFTTPVKSSGDKK